MPNLAALAAPLHALMTPKVPFEWTSECQRSFEALIKALTTAPVLALPREGCPVILDTDASDLAIGGVLSQVIEGKERVIAYASQALSTSQKNYCTTYKELLAVVRMAKIFRPYLYGQGSVLLRTDHRALVWLQNFKDAEGMLARWLASLAEYDFRIEYREGKKHGNADGCSRIPVRRCKRDDCPDPGHGDQGMMVALVQWNADKAHLLMKPWEQAPLWRQGQGPGRATVVGSIGDVADGSARAETVSVNQPVVAVSETSPGVSSEASPEVVTAPPEVGGPEQSEVLGSNWLNVWTREEIVAAQAQDSATALAVDWLKARQRPSYSDIADRPGSVRDIWAQYNWLHLKDGKLYREHRLPTGEYVEQLVIPSKLRRAIFDQLHTSRLGGHMRIHSTVAKVRR